MDVIWNKVAFWLEKIFLFVDIMIYFNEAKSDIMSGEAFFKLLTVYDMV